MANLRDIRRRIKSVRKTQKITNAMKMVASARLRRAEVKLRRARDYVEGVRTVVERLDPLLTPDEALLAQPRPDVRSRCLVVVSGERGLCGAFNGSVLSRAEKFLARHGGTRVLAIGQKGVQHFRKRGAALLGQHVRILKTLTYREAAVMAEDLMRRFLARELDEVVVLFHRFVSTLHQQMVEERLLPVPLEITGAGALSLAENEPEPNEHLKMALPQFVAGRFYQILLESAASEQGARRNAMESATDNAGEMIDRLTLLYNRTRQGAITTQILEVVVGGESLK